MTDALSTEGHGPLTAILAWSKSGADLASRRSQALAEYWLAMAGATQPQEAVSAQIGYWAHWVDDYATAAAKALSSFAPVSTGPTDAPSRQDGLH